MPRRNTVADRVTTRNRDVEPTNQPIMAEEYYRRAAIKAHLKDLKRVEEQLLRQLQQNVKVIIRIVEGSAYEAVERTQNVELATVVCENKKVANDGTVRITLSIPDTDKVSLDKRTAITILRYVG